MGLGALLEGQGLSQAETARRIGLTPDKLSRVCHGKRRLSGREAAALADVLGVTVAAVLAALAGESPAAAPPFPPEVRPVPAASAAEAAATIEYSWPDGHRVAITSTRAFDALTVERIHSLLALARIG